MLLLEALWASYSFAHSMVGHVDGCRLHGVLRGNRPSSLVQVGSGIGITFGLCHQVARSIAFPLLAIVGV